ncbi:MAG: HAD family hydrolase, partial [Candidatus Binataceae bacterium]
MAAKRRTAEHSHPKALLFDFGGTLAFLDFEFLAREFSRDGLKLDALALEHAEYAGRAALDRYLMHSGGRDMNQAYQQFFRGWMAAAGVPRDRIRELGERFVEINNERMLWRVVRPGTHEALAKFRANGIKLAIVSNADGRVEEDSKRYGLAEYFDAIIDSRVVGVEKPDPRIFQLALQRLGVAPEDARYAGDIYSIDMVGARAAGIEGRLIDEHGRYDWVDHHK